MAAATKTKRKVKGVTVDLSAFLGNQKAAPGFAVVTPKLDWADCVDDDFDDKYTVYRKEEKQIVLPTAPKAARGPDFDVSKIPSDPPFTAYIGNLPFDITEDEIIRFFGNLGVISVRLPRDGGDRGRMRGFGYAEFENKQTLIEALSLNGETLKNRPVKVSLAGENENDRNERKSDGVDRTSGDWRAAPKNEDQFSRNPRNSNRYDESDREPYRGRNSYGEDRNRYDGGRQSYQGRRSAEREKDYNFGSDRDRDRGNRDRDRGFNRRPYGDGYDRGFDRNARSDRRDDFDSRREDRAFNRGARTERREFDRDSMREENQERDVPKDRPRLQLKPRSVPVGEENSGNPSAASAIFGGAKPVDTAAKEREIEIRLAKEREKLDDGSKPKVGARGNEEPERSVKQSSVKSHADEPLREKNHTRGEGHNDKPLKDSARYAKATVNYNAGEQENGEPPSTGRHNFRKWKQQESNSSNKTANLNAEDRDLFMRKKPPQAPRVGEFQKEAFLSNKFAHLSTQED